MLLPKPTPVVASEERVAQTLSRVEELLSAMTAGSTEQAAARHALLELVKSLASRATYRVYVQTMRESHRITYWTTIVSSNQECLDRRQWHKGRITPFMSENLEHAEYEAANWAAFLGVEAEPWVKPEWHDSFVEELQARRQAAGKAGSGSLPEAGARVGVYAQQQADLVKRQFLGWYPILTVPRDGSVVDFSDGTRRLLGYRYADGCWRGVDRGDVLAEEGFTHWRYA